jgi:hypothetical protein
MAKGLGNGYLGEQDRDEWQGGLWPLVRSRLFDISPAFMETRLLRVLISF